MQNVTTITKKATTGMNAYQCPTCKAQKIRSTVFVPVNPWQMATIKARGAITRSAKCQDGHKVDVTLERLERLNGRYLMRRELANAR